MKNKTAKDIMTTGVIIANREDSIVSVAKLLIEEKIGGMPVVDENNKVVGIISETDIMKKEKYVEAPQAINILQGLLFSFSSNFATSTEPWPYALAFNTPQILVSSFNIFFILLKLNFMLSRFISAHVGAVILFFIFA